MLQPIFTWLANNQAIISRLTPVVAVLAGVILAVVAAMKAWAVIQTVLNVLVTANPIGLIILAIGALVAAIIIVVTHWRDFQGIVSAVWGVLQSLGAWVQAHWKLIVDVLLGPLGLLITNFSTVESVIMDVIGALELVGSKVSDALGWLGKIPTGSAGSPRPSTRSRRRRPPQGRRPWSFRSPPPPAPTCPKPSTRPCGTISAAMSAPN